MLCWCNPAPSRWPSSPSLSSPPPGAPTGVSPGRWGWLMYGTWDTGCKTRVQCPEDWSRLCLQSYDYQLVSAPLRPPGLVAGKYLAWRYSTNSSNPGMMKVCIADRASDLSSSATTSSSITKRRQRRSNSLNGKWLTGKVQERFVEGRLIGSYQMVGNLNRF